MFCKDTTSGIGAVAAITETNRTDVKIVSFDTDKGTLDAIKDGKIAASIPQGTWNMGFWALQMLLQLNHNLIDESGVTSAPVFVIPVCIQPAFRAMLHFVRA